MKESHRTCGRSVGELESGKEDKWTHFSTAGERFGRRVCKEGGHVVVVEVGGVMGESWVRLVLIVRGQRARAVSALWGQAEAKSAGLHGGTRFKGNRRSHGCSSCASRL